MPTPHRPTHSPAVCRRADWHGSHGWLPPALHALAPNERRRPHCTFGCTCSCTFGGAGPAPAAGYGAPPTGLPSRPDVRMSGSCCTTPFPSITPLPAASHAFKAPNITAFPLSPRTPHPQQHRAALEEREFECPACHPHTHVSSLTVAARQVSLRFAHCVFQMQTYKKVSSPFAIRTFPQHCNATLHLSLEYSPVLLADILLL